LEASSGVDVVIISRIENWITEHEKGSLMRSFMAHNWGGKMCNQNKDAQAWDQSHWSIISLVYICIELVLYVNTSDVQNDFIKKYI